MKELAPFIDRQFHPAGESQVFGEDSLPSEQELSLYLHIPFCRHICDFCSFPREIAHIATVRSYVEALAIQTQRFASCLSNPVESVYFGGGTPSILLPEQLSLLMNAVSLFHVSEGAQFTLEARSDDITEDFLTYIKSLGINRLSVGVQTLDKKARQIHGLPESPENVYRKLELLAESDMITNLDLIYGSPYQNLESWKETLDIALSLKPEQISAFPFMLLAGTPASEHCLPQQSWKYLYLAVKILLEKTGQHGYLQTDAFMFTHIDLLSQQATTPNPSLPHKPYKDLRCQPIVGLGQGAFSMLPTKFAINPYDIHGFCRHNNPNMEYLVHEGPDVSVGYHLLKKISSQAPSASHTPPTNSEVLHALVASQLWKNIYQTARDWYTYSGVLGFHTTAPTKNLPKNHKYQG